MEVLSKKMTAQEFLVMEVSDDDPFNYELLNGILVRRTTPTGFHQSIQSKLFGQIFIHITQNDLGSIYSSPIGVVLSENDVPQPDLVFLSKENSEKFDMEWGIKGAPDLVVEILSPTSVSRDKNQKMKLYEKHGISEYWIVYPEYKFIEIYNLENGKYTLSQSGDNGDSIKSKIIKDFELKVESIFTTP